MATEYEIEQLKAALERARGQLAMLEASAGIQPKDTEARRRIRKAATRIEVLSTKLANLGVKL
jgi:hypothetical protein